MSHSYPSDISREQFVRNVGVGPPSDQAPHREHDVFCGVLYLLKSGCQWERGLPQLAHLLPVFPAMERAAWPRSGFPGASPKKIGWRGPTKQWTERADQYRGLPERQEHGHRR